MDGQLSWGRVYVAALIGLALLLAGLAVVMQVRFGRYNFEGARLRPIEIGRARVVMEDAQGYTLVMTADPANVAGTSRIDYRGRVITRTWAWDTDTIYVFSDGSRVAFPRIIITVGGQSNAPRLTNLQDAERALLHFTAGLHERTRTTREVVQLVLLAIILTAAVLFIICFPEVAAEMRLRRWVWEAEEPSDTDIKITRITGAVFIFIIFIGLGALLW